MSPLPADPAFRLMLVADDLRRAARIERQLAGEGFRVMTHLASGHGSVPEAIRRGRPEAVLLDLDLSLDELLTLCRTVRVVHADALLLLCDSGGEEDEVAGLAAGADDLLPRSVPAGTLCARIRARVDRLRRAAVDPDRIVLPCLEVDAGRQAARVGHRWIDLSTAEFEVLWLLARDAGRTVPRGEICTRLRGFSYDGCDRTIDLRVARLRRRLGDDGRHPRLIKSVRGEGYMLVLER